MRREKFSLLLAAWFAIGVSANIGATSSAPAPGAAPAPSIAPTPGTARIPVVAELFTSQGCNSCPPADKLLGELAHQPNVIALAFHVQYWDRLGWADPYGLPLAERRQQGYVQRLQLAGGYTPQLVLNASRSVVGSNGAQINTVLRSLSTVANEAVEIKLTRNESGLSITVPPGTQSRNDAEVLLLPLISQADTAIANGENGGRTLREYNIVRDLRVLGRWHGAAASYSVALASLPKGTDSVAVLLQAPEQRAILGASLLRLR